MAFKGWLIKFGEYPLPNKFLKQYKDTSNQRIEVSAYRDVTMLLHRETSPNYKSSIVLSIMELNLQEMNLLKNIINSGITDAIQRKVEITYWNSEDMDYKTGDFYMPDIQKSIHFVEEDSLDMHYEAFDIELIEY